MSEVGNSMSQMFNFLNPANTIFASYTLANTLSGNEDTIDSATYTLSDPSEMTAFVEEAEGLIDTETYSIQTNDQMYQSMLTPLNNVASFAKNIIVLVAAAGIIILTLIVMMSIRERRYEIGVLLSLGESRAKVILQFFTEIFVCMVFALGIAAASGNLVGNAVGEQLLAQQTKTTTTVTTENAGPGGGRCRKWAAIVAVLSLLHPISRSGVLRNYCFPSTNWSIGITRSRDQLWLDLTLRRRAFCG